MTAEPNDTRQSRGDRQREAIITAVRELLEERSFAELSVSTISERAGVARSGFYFYFESKYAVLAVIVADAMEELDKLTHDFAPREPDESPQTTVTEEPEAPATAATRAEQAAIKAEEAWGSHALS